MITITVFLLNLKLEKYSNKIEIKSYSASCVQDLALASGMNRGSSKAGSKGLVIGFVGVLGAAVFSTILMPMLAGDEYCKL